MINKLTAFLLVFISIQVFSLRAMPAAASYAQQQKPYEKEKCTQRGISPSCDDELDHPIDENKLFTIESARQLIKSGVTTAKDLYEMGAITLQQKQHPEVEFMPERL